MLAVIMRIFRTLPTVIVGFYKFAETLPSRPGLRKVEAFKGKWRPFAKGLALDYAPIVGNPTFRVGQDLESLRHQREHRCRLRTARVKLGMKLAGASLVGAAKFGRGETSVDAQNRVEVGHDLSALLSILTII